ncbi:unnamed protein product [Closterium sp. NIES-64]|nr:unnamed protein product [Closterium sp. NIES-64]
MDKYELRWSRMFSRREEERPRREPSSERGRSLEISPRRPAFRADRIPLTRDRREEGSMSEGAGNVGRVGGVDRDAWLRERARLQVEGTDAGDGGEDQAVGIDVAEPAQADENAGASHAEESHRRNANRGDEQRAEGSLRQERVAQDESGRNARMQRQRGKGKAERSRTPKMGQYCGDWRGGDFRSDDRRGEQGGWSGGVVRSLERQQARGGRWKDEPRSPEPHGR